MHSFEVRLVRTSAHAKELPVASPLKYADHVDRLGTKLFQCVCELDLEGRFAKHAISPYVADGEETTWYKILNPEYSQRLGREELFERDRHKAVPGWHRCSLACADLEEVNA